MIEETVAVIDQLEETLEAELQARYARRNKIRHIDSLLNELEMLNLADEFEVPLELKGRVVTFLKDERHAISERPVEATMIGELMEALYDVQDTLMIPFEDDFD